MGGKGWLPIETGRNEKGRSLMTAAPDSRRFEKERYAFWPTRIMVIGLFRKTFSFFLKI